MTTAPPALEDTEGESERAGGFECSATVASEKLQSESNPAESTGSHEDVVPQNNVLADTSSSDGEDDDDHLHIGSGYVLLSQDDSHENEICTCADETAPSTVEEIQTEVCAPCTSMAERGFQIETEQVDVITRYAEPGTFIAPVAKMESDEVSAIVKAMSGFCLPETITPDWAKVVPEEVWKAELLAGLRKHSKPHH